MNPHYVDYCNSTAKKQQTFRNYSKAMSNSKQNNTKYVSPMKLKKSHDQYKQNTQPPKTSYMSLNQGIDK